MNSASPRHSPAARRQPPAPGDHDFAAMRQVKRGGVIAGMLLFSPRIAVADRHLPPGLFQQHSQSEDCERRNAPASSINACETL